jgi:hypothetical protein
VRVLGEEPGLGLPNQHTKACPRFQTMHCWCPPATGPGQPHESDCFQYKRPGPAVPVTHAFIGSYHDWDLMDPDEPIDVVKKYLPEQLETGPFFGHGLQYAKYSPEAWTFGKMAAKLIEDATAAAESATGQGELLAAEIKPEIKPESPLWYVQNHAMQLQVQAQVQAFNHALQWSSKQKPESYVPDPILINELNELCTCAAASVGACVGHAWECPLSDAAVTVAKLGPAAK